MQIWAAGSDEDYKTVTASTGEPVISSMGMTQDANEGLAWRPSDDTTSAYQLWQIQNKRSILRKEYLDHWQRTAAVTGTGRPVDGIIGPAARSVATPHGQNK